MADVKISELAAANDIALDEELPINQGGATVKAAVKNFSVNPINSQSVSSYTVTADDQGKVVQMNLSSANSVLLPAAGHQIGATVMIRQGGTGKTTISADTGASLVHKASVINEITEQYGQVCAQKISAASWLIFGDLVLS